LETNISAFDGLTYLGRRIIRICWLSSTGQGLDVTLEDRNAGHTFCWKSQAADGLNGFAISTTRSTNFDAVILRSPRCARLFLTHRLKASRLEIRKDHRPVETDVKRCLRRHHVNVQKREFRQHIDKLQAFQVRLLNTLQKAGQTAFYIDYEDLQDVDVMVDLLAFLK
jgi:hypothetical protein